MGILKLWATSICGWTKFNGPDKIELTKHIKNIYKFLAISGISTSREKIFELKRFNADKQNELKRLKTNISKFLEIQNELDNARENLKEVVY